MRRLLIKLVAIETMLVGWLSYWIFLVYANNPSVSAGLGDQLSRFPQLAFSAVDVAVFVIIAVFAIMLAFKFHSGLRPGIRLERALQMLENMMKRNLLLEAQVAELRVEKSEKGGLDSLPTSSSSPSVLTGKGLATAVPPQHTEPSLGSWEKAFRTPLEAGAPAVDSEGSNVSDVPFQHETGIPPRRTDIPPAISNPAKAVPVIPEKSGLAKPSSQPEERPEKSPTFSPSAGSSAWEDSPRHASETAGVHTPSDSLKKVGTVVADSRGLRQPYIPIPAPRAPPPSVIVGPTSQKPSSPTREAPRPVVRPTFPSKALGKEFSTLTPSTESRPPNVPPVNKSEPKSDSKSPEPASAVVPVEDKTTKNFPGRLGLPSRKRQADEED